MAFAGDNLVLKLFAYRNKVGVVARYAHKEVPVILRVRLGVP